MSPSVIDPFSSFDDLHHHHHHHHHRELSNSESMLFGIDIDDSPKQDPFSSPWDDSSIHPFPPPSPNAFSASPASTCSQLDLSSPPQSFSPNSAFPPLNNDPHSPSQQLDYSSWLVDDLPPSAPIAIPSASSPPLQSPFSSTFDKLGAFSPSLEFAALVPLSDALPDHQQSFEPSYTTSPSSSSNAFWSFPLTDASHYHAATATAPPQLLHAPSPPQQPFVASSFDHNPTTIRARPHRHSMPSASGIFQLSASAPSDFPTTAAAPASTRAYSTGSGSGNDNRRAESVSLTDDRDATIRRKRKAEGDPVSPPATEDHHRLTPSPQRSHLRPPKLAPSTWQLWFADWIQRQQATSDRKLNVAQAAKEAGAEYAGLSPEEKEPYARRSQQLKDIREREHALWMQSLSPEDIKRENSFRAAQRKAGKSRKGNIKDPNAPKKPLSAYFNFIQSIRADPARVREVFGDETETTRQSVLAAQKWRSMSDEEKRPFLAQAEHDRLEYEAAKKLYDEATTGHSSGVSFSVLQGGGFVHSMLRPMPAPTSRPQAGSESDSDGELALRKM